MIWLLTFSTLSLAQTVQNGVLDLRTWDFQTTPVVAIEGKAQFHWQRFLSEDGPAPEPAYLSVPAPWNSHKAYTPHGYGTYEFEILLPSDMPVSFLFQSVWFSARYFVNGMKIRETGSLSRTPVSSRESLASPWVHEVRHHQGRLHLRIEVSNFDRHAGGLIETHMIGTPIAVQEKMQFMLLKSAFLLGALFFMGLYHLVLYALRTEDRSTLYFALNCLCMTLFCSFAESSRPINLLHIFPIQTSVVIYSFAWYTITACFALYLRALFPAEASRKIAGFVVGSAIVSIMPVFFLSIIQFETWNAGFLSITAFHMLYSIWVAGKAIKARRAGSRVFMSALVIFGFTVFHDALHYRNIIHSVPLLSLGLFIFTFGQSILLSMRFSRAFKDNELYAVELAERDRSRTAFFHNTSHELRTPLNGMIGFLELIQKNHFGNLPDRVHLQIDKSLRLAHSLKNQVNTILDLARAKRGELGLKNSAMDLNEMKKEFDNLAEGLQLRHAESHYTSEIIGDDGPRSFINDREKIYTIGRNLLGNAFKFVRPGTPNHVVLRLIRTKEGLTLEVRDQGIGIAENFKDRIFDEFVQVDDNSRRAYEGTGLGLAMVRDIVKLMEGRIEVESEPGRGSCFRIRIPEQKTVDMRYADDKIALAPVMSLVPLAARDHALPIEAATASSGYKLLVVDDNEINCDVMQEILTAKGHQVTSALGGRAALDYLRNERPDLVFLDLMMPEVSGEDVLKTMRQDPSLRDIPTILITARASEEDRLLGLALGADDYIAKPIISEEVVLRVRNTLSRIALARETSTRMTIESTLAQAQEIYKALGYAAGPIPDIEMDYHYQPAELTSGDWFGATFHATSGHLFVLMGDVTGHGVPAALVTIAVAGAIKGALSVMNKSGHEWSMESALKELHQAAHEAILEASDKMDRGMTMLFGCLDVGRGLFTYLNAGHPPPYLLGRHRTLNLVQPGPVLGAAREVTVTVTEVAMEAGDTLILYTDGLIENQGPDGHSMGHRTLKQCLDREKSPTELKRAILARSLTICKDHPAEDDCTFLVLRWKGAEVANVVKQRVSGD